MGRPNVTPLLSYLIARNGRVVYAYYLFNPARWNIPDPYEPASRSSWRPAVVGKDPAKARVLNLLASQGQELSEVLKAGLASRAVPFTWRLEKMNPAGCCTSPPLPIVFYKIRGGPLVQFQGPMAMHGARSTKISPAGP